MANNSPTIVVASLSDDQLKKSIDALVTHVDEAMKKMVQSTNNAVGEMEAKLKSLGNLKIDSGGTNDGGASKRAKAQNAETDAIDKAIAARGKQIKQNQEAAMSFDQMANAQQKAISGGKFLNFNEAELDRMKAKLRELEAEYVKINREGGGLATENRSNALRSQIQSLYSDITLYENALKNLTNVQKHQADTSKKNVRLNDEYPKLIEWYKQLEQEDQKRIKRLEKMIELAHKAEEEQKKAIEAANKRAFGDNLSGAFSMSERSVDQMLSKIRRLQSFLDSNKASGFTLLSEAQVNRINNSIDKINDKLAKQDQQRVDAIRKQQEAEERASQKRLADLERERAAQDKAISSYQDKALRSAWRDALRMPTENIDQATAKIERIKSLISTLHPIGIISRADVDNANAVVLRLEKQYRIQQQTAQSAHQYTEEIRKQAQAIRESEQWKKTGDYGFIINEETGKLAWVTVKDRRSIEEQLVFLYREESSAVSQVTQLENVAKDAARERLGTEQAITQEQEKRKKYVSPNTEINTAFNRMVANKIGLSEQDINTTSTKISALTQYIKQLEQAWSKMTDAEKNSPFGKQLRQELQYTTRLVQQARTELTRPINLKDALSGSEKTLDDITYKMQRLASYRSGLNVETQRNEIDQVNKKYAELKKNMNDVMQKNSEMIASNTALGRSWNYMKNRLAFYFTVGASTQFVKQLIDISGQYELLDRSIGILIDSAQNGSQIFAELNAMAIKSPFTTMELGAAAKQLVAYDVAAKDVVDTTRRLADMAAAVGIPIERLTYALGQIKAYGYLNARDARMFANAGIPLVKELADYYTELEGRLVSTADVYDRIKKKAIDYNDVMSVVNKMTDEGGKFFDFQEKAADTLKVRIANLTLAWNNMLNEMGKDNQGILTEGLKVTKQIFESWRDINNAIVSIGITYGSLKAAQIAYYLWVMRTEKAVGAWAKIVGSIEYAFNAKIANVINSLKTSLVGFFTNPAAMVGVAFTALSVALTKAYLDYRDLQAANEEFNKSVVKNAEENVKSIDKFFEDYKKQLESVGSLNSADQTKLWERVQEEIEKTTKNAEKYIEILNKIPEVSKRIEVGESVLEQSKRIQDELKYMAERGMFNVGGGFANDSAAKDLQQYSDAVNELITKYGDLNNAKKEALKVNEITLESGETIRQYTGEYADFQRAQIEAEKELQNIVSTLDKVNMAEILGTGDMETQLANVRSFAIAWRDAFLATEKGSKISAEGQALLNSYIDKWIEQQARVNHLIKDENTAAVEANRTAWEAFFKFLNTEERKRLDVAIKTHQTGSNSVKELWDKAAERMQEKATTSYNLIKEQIADLRNTPDIVINVVYRNNKEILEKDQEEFEKKYIQPKDWSALSTDEYIKQEKANREKYGTLMRKQGEDAVEYEKRISDERKTNLELQKKNGDIIEENKNKTDAFSRAVTEQAKKEKQAADDRLKVIKEVEDAGGYDFSTKSENAAARKAAKQAESELQKALKDELSTIEKVRSIYKDLTKEGMSHADAVAKATKGWNETVNAINKVLSKNGMKKLNLADFVGVENPREMMNTLQEQLESMVKRGASSSEIKVIQEKIRTLEVDADKYDLTKITKGLNNELDRLKEEYELAVALDADPELGGIFANYMGINLEDLPKTAEEAAKKAQEYIDKILAENNSSEKIDISSLMDKKAFDSWVESSGHSLEDELVKRVSAFRSYLHKVNVDETKNQAQEWNKLLEKYAEYEYKVTQIQKEAEREREVARKKGASQDVFDAINNRERQEIARVGFEKFQKSPEWIAATGDLANMSKSAIEMLIEELERYRRSAKNLSPKEIKQLNNALSKLYKEQRKNNPFKAVANMFDEAKEKMSIFDEEIEETQKQIDELYKKHKTNLIDGIADDDTQKKLKETKEKLSKLKEERNNIGKIDASTWVSSINETISAVKSAIEVFDGLAKAIDGVENSDVDKVFSILDSAGKGASTGAAFGPYGAIIGGVVGAAAGVVNAFADVWSGNERINKSIEVSTQKVRALEREYKRLERAVDDAYGTDSIGAQRLMMLNKEAELAELERQLELEKSRKAKNKDQEKIDELRDKVDELRYEVNNAAREIILDLLEIGDAQDWANDFVKGMIDAFREGENYMKSYEDAFREMIDNMIAKTIAGKVIGERIEQMIANIKEIAKTRAEGDASVVAARDALDKLEQQRNNFYALREGGENVPEDVFDQVNKDIADAQKIYDEIYTKAVQPTPEDVQGIRESISSWKDDVKNEFDTFMEAFGVEFGSAKDSQQLSALQQGIQGVSEETAGAVEAYLNGMSQQAYLRNELLTQIRDAIMGTNSDIQLGVQGQMLLQLQQSFQVQMAIQGILEGVLTPSGQGFRVELLS